jgi:DNA polymerase I-like protein with 3'-5' exonuclease and polymerase domains
VVHDEVNAEVRDDCVEEYTELAEESIVEAGRRLGLSCPHKGDGEAGINWYEVH